MPTTETITEKQNRRFQMLATLYDRVGGSRQRGYDFESLGGSLGIYIDDLNDARDYFVAEGLIEITHSGRATLTHRGIAEVESAFSRPSEATEHFPPQVINILNIGNANSATIQQGTTHSSQSVDVGIRVGEARRVLELVRSELASAVVSEPVKGDIEASVESAEAQLKRANPAWSVVKDCLVEIRNAALTNHLLPKAIEAMKALLPGA